MADVHVTPDGDDWNVTHDDDTLSTHRTQQDAIDAARGAATAAGCEVVIHGQDGQIRAKDSEGNDPRNIPG